MKLSKKYQIEKAASTDETRKSINQVYVDAKNKCLVAMTGRILAKVPVEIEETDTGSFIPVDVLATGRKLSNKSANINIKLNQESFELSDKSTFPRKNEDLVVPRYEQLIPSKDREVFYKVTLNPFLLVELAKALGCWRGEGVTLEFSKDSRDSFVVRVDEVSVGVMMPMVK